jgi:hypothetical protein
MAAKRVKPTKAQRAEAKVRAAASGISMNQSAKGLRNASKAIIAGASMLPAGRAVKAATTASRIAKTAATKNSARKNSNMVGRVANKNLKDYQQHDIKNWTPSKPSVKVKPAAKQKPNSPNISKIVDRQLRRSFGAEGEEMPSRRELVQMRQLITGARPVTQPKGFGSGASRVKINSNPVRANRKRSGQKAKKK